MLRVSLIFYVSRVNFFGVYRLDENATEQFNGREGKTATL